MDLSTQEEVAATPPLGQSNHLLLILTPSPIPLLGPWIHHTERGCRSIWVLHLEILNCSPCTKSRRTWASNRGSITRNRPRTWKRWWRTSRRRQISSKSYLEVNRHKLSLKLNSIPKRQEERTQKAAIGLCWQVPKMLEVGAMVISSQPCRLELPKYRLTSNLGTTIRQLRIKINHKEFICHISTIHIRTVDTYLAF